MELTKAIEILTIHNDHNPNFTDADREKAHQLGIEALKIIQDTPGLRAFFKFKLLPSETPPEKEK